MTIPTIDRETHTFRLAGRAHLVRLLLNVAFLILVECVFAAKIGINPTIASSIVIIILIVIQLVRIVVFLKKSSFRIEIQGDQIRFFTGQPTPKIEESLRNVENLTIRIKGGVIGIASWRRIDFKGGESIIFDGQVEGVEKLEDLLTERSGKKFLRWLTGEAYQKPKNIGTSSD